MAFKDLFKIKTPIPEEEVKDSLSRSLPDVFKQFFKPKKEKLVSPVSAKRITSTPTPTPTPAAERFRKGFESYGSELSAASEEFARYAQENPLPDPYMPAVIALMETSGGKKQRFAYNPFNWGMQDMPNLPHAIERIYSGISKRYPYYEDYRKSGDLEDLFKHYTPPGDWNPSVKELKERYNELRKLFD